ncbi:MAG: TetR/AcrR family transcriptional regulator [Nitriliruptoraceae bacterium]
MEKRATNRGPAAAAGNRRALLDAARRLFAEHGYRVPLSAVAREAGVGQGTLYRHFPTRLDLAFAIFEDNFAELERIATESTEPGNFAILWRRLIEQTLESTAFVEVAVAARREVADTTLAERLARLLGDPLQRAQAAGLVAPNLTVADLLLIHRMIYGVIVTEPGPAGRRASVQRALIAIDPALAWSLPATGSTDTAVGRR